MEDLTKKAPVVPASSQITAAKALHGASRGQVRLEKFEEAWSLCRHKRAVVEVVDMP